MSSSTRSNRRSRNKVSSETSSDNESDNVSNDESYSSNSRKRSRTSSTSNSHTYSDDEVSNYSQPEYFNNKCNNLDLTQLDEEYQLEMTKAQQHIKKLIKPFINTCFPYFKHAITVSSIYIFWIALHFTTAHVYVQFCAYPSLYGFLLSPFLISSPHCSAMRWIFTKGGTLIDGMWIILGTWLCSKLLYHDV